MALYRLDELKGQPIGHFNGTVLMTRISLSITTNCTTDYLENATSGEKVVEETLARTPAEINCLITHQPDWGSIQIQHVTPN